MLPGETLHICSHASKKTLLSLKTTATETDAASLIDIDDDDDDDNNNNTFIIVQWNCHDGFVLVYLKTHTQKTTSRKVKLLEQNNLR